ncbi:MAG: hypothetical protein IK115_07710 [Lachnospiraceae bacterium]|nr:hypothetical protein [Lachnospiraceae bacterium]
MGMTFEFSGLSDMMPDIDEVGIEMVEAAGPILVEKTKKAVQGVVRHEGESELVKSVTMSKPKKGKWGDFIVSAYFKGSSKTKTYRHTKTHRGKYAVSNALKAVWKEYGIPSRGIPAQPFIEQATAAAETEALDAMQDVFDKRVGE